jgi:hypothetical protein
MPIEALQQIRPFDELPLQEGNAAAAAAAAVTAAAAAATTVKLCM